MKRYIPFKCYFILLFFILCGVSYYVIQLPLKQKINHSTYYHLNQLRINYAIWLANQSEVADIIYEQTMLKPKVKEIIEKAWVTNSKQERDNYRAQLYELLYEEYQIFKKKGLLQYHFVFPNNHVFLRIHKREKFGDDLTKIRQDFEKVNKTHEVVRGFSEGRTAHAIRNVYPIFSKDNKAIGAIEISYPTELFQKKMNDVSKIHTHYLVKKSIFDIKAWPRDDRIQNYRPSYENKDYLMANSKVHDESNEEVIKGHLSKLSNVIAKKIQKPEPFSLYSKHEGDTKIIAFYPIFQNTTAELVSWIVSYNDDPFIVSAEKDTMNAFTLFIIFLAILVISLYFLLKQKRNNIQLLSSYDENVIFSKTDLNGRITHASSAFCEMSGFKLEELIGKSHNIIRHPDMSKEFFTNMWETIKKGNSWKGEIKNRKKNGGFYWVSAEIEPDYDFNGNLIGYNSIRHDITDSKEIEDVQKEIIFTMGTIGESHSQETGNHVKRVAAYSELLARLYKINEKEVKLLKEASPMHDIGKIAIPDAILQKPGALDKEEWEIIKTHPAKGYEMLKHSKRPLLKAAAIVAYEHHEKYDGTGYPRGLSGDDIHIYGRIVALVDVYDALGSDRVYKKAWKEEKVLALIKEERGKHFDPILVDLFLDNYSEFCKIRQTYVD